MDIPSERWKGLAELELDEATEIQVQRYFTLQVRCARQQRRLVGTAFMVLVTAWVMRLMVDTVDQGAVHEHAWVEDAVDLITPYIYGAIIVMVVLGVALFQYLSHRLYWGLASLNLAPSKLARIRQLGQWAVTAAIWGKLGLQLRGVKMK